MSLKYSNTGRLPKIFGRFIIVINSCNPDFFNFVFFIHEALFQATASFQGGIKNDISRLYSQHKFLFVKHSKFFLHVSFLFRSFDTTFRKIAKISCP